MDEDITLNPQNDSNGVLERQREELTLTRDAEPSARQQMQMRSAAGVKCPHCGTINDPEALYCASCGNPIGKTACPNCGADLDPDADFCESCCRYIKHDICSFCGARLGSGDAFCPECGSPRGGIVCPVCHTLNDFSFCKQCGTALTDEAKQLRARIHEMPQFKELQKYATEIQQLEQSLPYTSERDVLKDQRNIKLRERVLTLLAQDRGVANPVIPASEHQRLSKEEYEAKKRERLEQIAAILDKMVQKPEPSAAKVRNYAMACRPQGVRLAWECNFKHALHSSPCGCAKPQLGGKWLILGKDVKKEIKDDK